MSYFKITELEPNDDWLAVFEADELWFLTEPEDLCEGVRLLTGFDVRGIDIDLNDKDNEE